MQGCTLGTIDPLTDTVTSEAKRIEQESGVHLGAFSVACMITAVGLSLQAGGDASHVAKLVQVIARRTSSVNEAREAGRERITGLTPK